MDFAKGDFRLKPDAKVFKDLPGFQPIPFDKIGLFVDEYRRRLPSDAEAGRVGSGPMAKRSASRSKTELIEPNPQK